MPSKRALAESDANEQPKPKRGTKTADKENAEQNDQSKQTSEDSTKNFPPYEYCCMNRPLFDFETENDEKAEEDPEKELEHEDLIEAYNAQLESKAPSDRPLKDHPDHKWMCMWETWTKYCDYTIRAQYCDQDNFDMHIYEDFTGYGLQEVVENMFVEFNKILTKTDKSGERLKQLWAMTATIAHFLTQGPFDRWYAQDDSQGQSNTVKHIGLAFLSALNEIDLAGQMKADSEFKDLSLVMATFLHWSGDGTLSDLDSMDSCLEWRLHVVEYAKKAGIDLGQSVVLGTTKILDEIEEEHEEIEALDGEASADRWKWKKAHKKFVENHSTAGSGKKAAIGGDKYNIVKWSRAERKKYNFDGKDPLAQFTEAELKSGGLMVG